MSREDYIGVDEAGRGPWAGPVCFAAVSMRGLPSDLLDRLKDSKSLTARRRDLIFCELQKSGARIGLHWSSPRQIDSLGLTRCSVIGMSAAVSQIMSGNERIIVDGNYNYLGEVFDSSEAVIKADAKYVAVSAASIVAKVMRDRYMKRCAARFQDFGFDAHVGYGTSKHKDALLKLGPTILHRQSFRPVAEASGVN